MRKILIFGSGRSAPSLIQYLAKESVANQWQITIADKDIRAAQKFIAGLNNCKAVSADIHDDSTRDTLVAEADLVLSMLPMRFHTLVLSSCLKHKVNLVTPSYESDGMREKEEEIRKAGILVLNEMGLDPGIDHMSAMRVIDNLRDEGHRITVFESFTGGLMAPGYDDNPWQFKFTWNPRNVVLAGRDGAVRFRHNGRYKYIPYTKLFRRTERIEIEGYGAFEGYANRDSLKYLEKYGLQNVETIYRGTLRRPGFCRAWDLFVQLGVTDDSFIVEDSEHMTFREFINSFLPYNPHDSVELKLMYYLRIDQDSGLMEKLQSLGIFTDEVIGLKRATPAQILEHILKKSWTIGPDDKDMIVMWHKFFFKDKDGNCFQKTSSMVTIGEDADHTAMARTVGLPMGMAAKMILNGNIDIKGLHLPIKREIYDPVLDELQKYDIEFTEKTIPIEDDYEDQPIF